MNKKAGAHAGVATVEVNGLKAAARVRVVPPLAWSEDFEGFGAEGPPFPVHWIGAANKFKVIDKDGGKVLVKPPAKRGLHRSNVYMGPPSMSGYTIQADLLGSKNKRRRPDMGLIANRYTLDMIGNHQRLQIRSWASDLRMAKTIDFAWEPEVWYTMKLRVDTEADKAVIRGKVWPRDQAEPEAWTITAEDPLPNPTGSPALYGYSPVEVYYDNIKVWKSK